MKNNFHFILISLSTNALNSEFHLVLYILGIPGLVLIVMFAFNSSYIGSRLGICWEVLAEKHKEFRDQHVRDPYPLIAEKAGLEKGKNISRILRSVAVGNFILFLYINQ